MKAKYIVPQLVQVNVQVERMISESTTTQNVYTDDSQEPANAMTKSQSSNLWDDDWSE